MSAEAAPAKFLFVFFDGVGLGKHDADVNPFAAARMERLRDLIGAPPTERAGPRHVDGVVFRSLDAQLGHTGLPQSATGQTALLTGRNGAEIMSGHYGPWPGPTLQRELDKETLFHRAPGVARLANAYPPGYFAALEDGRARVNAPVYAARHAGVSLFDLDDYRAGRGIAADLTGDHFTRLEPDVAPISARAAGERLAGASRGATFTFFDQWLTDRIGHRGTFMEAVTFAERLDGFVGGLVDALRSPEPIRANEPESVHGEAQVGGVTMVLTSDHGNFEDKSVRTHTAHPVPLLAVGPHADAFTECTSILDVYPAIVRVWEG